MRIDAFAHVLPDAYHRAVVRRAGSHPHLTLWERNTALRDVPFRLALLDEFEVDKQVVTTPLPPLEDIFAGDRAAAGELARLANDGMAELVAAHPDRWLGVATISLLDPDEAVRELQRSVRELGLVGAQVYSSAAGRPLDGPELEPFWSAAEALDVPVWLHPERSVRRPDYAGEEASRYRLYMTFGWPYETTLAMARLVLGGVMSRHPRLKIVAHHAGAMVPFFAGRIERIYGDLRLPDGAGVMDAFRRFYVDTCTWGSVGALIAAHETFGAGHMLMGSDVPFGPDAGRNFLRETVRSLEYLPLPPSEKEQVWSGNLRRLCGLDG